MAKSHKTDAEDMPVEMEPDEKDKERATQFYLEAFEPYIRNCISMSDLKKLIFCYKPFKTDEREKLLQYSCPENKTPPDVFDEILRVIRNKVDDCKKYTAFAKAFEDIKHEKISLILSGAAQPLNENHKALIYQCGVDMCDNLNVRSILPNLVSKDIISPADSETLQAALDVRGNFDAAFRLLLLLPNKKADWYVCFMETLLGDKQEDLANKINTELKKKMLEEGADIYQSMVMDQSFSQRPTARIPPYAGSGTSNQDDSIGLDIMSVDEEPEQMNDLDAPLPAPNRFESLTAIEETTMTETSNLQEFNIKPDQPEKLQSVISGDKTKYKLLYSRTRESDRPGSITEAGNDSGETHIKQKCTDEAGTSSNYTDAGNAATDDDDDNNEDDSEDNLSSEESSDDDFPGSGHGKLELRNYQLELAENAVAGINTVVCAATGSGKTWVALHIVKEHLARNKEGKKKVVFMARTSTLIKQQADRIKTYLSMYQTKLITGENEESNNIGMFMEHYDILCLTPQILVNNLETGAVGSLAVFSLLILDECHHTKGSEPYHNLMKKYLLEKMDGKRKDLPQVVGLTASIGVGKAHTDIDACDYILCLCASLDVRVLSTVQRYKEDYNKEISHPEEEMIQMVKPSFDPCKKILMQAILETENIMEDIALLVPSMIEMMTKKCPRDKESQEYNQWTVEIEQMALLTIQDHFMARDVRACAIYLNVYSAALEVNSLLGPSDVITFLAKNHEKEAHNQDKLTTVEKDLLKYLRGVQKQLRQHRDVENENVQRLCNILKEMMEKDPDSCRAMVFVEARATCTALTSYLKRFKDIGMDAHYLYGKDSRGGEDGMTESEQNETVEKFRLGVYKILVATSVGVEGIDVPNCNIVLNYNFQGNEITKIQMKGRSRKKEGHNVVMGNEKMLNRERMNAYKLAMMERAMKLFLNMNPKVIERKISLEQLEIIRKYKMQRKIVKANLSRKSTDVNFEILCKGCGVLACYTSDIKLYDTQHFVIDRSFADKIDLKKHMRPARYHGIHKKYKMSCKNCPMDWGIVSEHKGLPCRTLKLKSFNLRNIQTGDSQSYKKWDDVPVAIPKVQLEDLPRLLG